MLHTLHRSPFCADVPALIRMLVPGDDLLLIQDGVIAALNNSHWCSQFQAVSVQLFVLQDDVMARGLSGHISSAFVLVGYNDFVALTLKHAHQMAW